MFRATALNRALFTTRAVEARRALLRDQDRHAVQYMQTNRFVNGLLNATRLDQLQTTLNNYNRTAISPKHVSLMAYKIGQLHQQEGISVDDEGLRSTALNLIEKNLDAFSVSSIASLLMSLKRWRWPYPTEWPEKLSKRLFGHHRLSYRSLSRSVPVLTDLGITDEQIWKDVITIIERQLPFMDQLSVAHCLYGVSRAKQGNVKFYERIVNFLEPRVFSLDPSVLSNIALSLSKVKEPALDLRELFLKISEQVLRQLPIYKDKDLKLVVTAFTAVMPGHTKLFGAISDHISLHPENYQTVMKHIQSRFRQIGFQHDDLFKL